MADERRGCGAGGMSGGARAGGRGRTNIYLCTIGPWLCSAHVVTPDLDHTDTGGKACMGQLVTLSQHHDYE